MSLLDNLKKIKNAAQLATTAAEGTNPVGWAMIIAKYRKQIMKAMAAGIGLFILLLLALWQKFVGAAFGFGFGAVTGLPLLLIPGAGPFLYVAWTSFWTYRGWTHPEQTIHLATHPWEIITTPISKAWGYISSGISKGWNYSVSYLEGTPNAIGSTISGGLSGFGHWITGLGSSLVNGAIGIGGSLLGSAVELGSSLLGHLTGVTGVAAGKIAAVTVGTTGAAVVTLSILNTGVLTPGKFFTSTTDTGVQAPHNNPFVSITKTASPSSIPNSDIPKTINYRVAILAKTNKILVAGCSDTTIVNKKDGTTQMVNSTFDPATCPPSIDAGQTVTLNYSLNVNDPAIYTDSTIINTFKIDYDLDTGGGDGTTSCNTNFSFAVSQIALPQIYCGASAAFEVPAAIISAFSAVEGSQVFGYTDDQISQFSAPGAKDPYKAGFEPYAESIIGCTVSSNGAAGPMQFLYGPAQPLVSSPVYPGQTAETDLTWGQYRTAVNDAGDPRTPQVCNIKDAIYATAKKNRADCGVTCPNTDWTIEQVAGAVLSYFPDCTTKWASLGNKSYCEFVWDWYQSHKVP